MERSDRHLRREVLDGQEIYYPTMEGWDRLAADPSIDGVRLAVPDIVIGKAAWLRHVGDVRIGLSLILSAGKPQWYSYDIVVINDQEYRVFIERQICSCGWRGLTATASLPDSYVGCPNSSELKRKGFALPVVGCPTCQALFRRRQSVWVGPATDGSSAETPLT